MGTRRITYAISLACALFFYILYPYWFSWYLLEVLLLLLPLDLIISLPGMLSRKLLITAPMVLEQDMEAALVIITIRKRPFPARCIKARMKTRGDNGNSLRRHLFSAKHESRYTLGIDTSHSGVTNYSMKRIWVISLLGFFSFPNPTQFEAPVLVLPPPIKPPHTVALPRSMVFRPKPGGGFAEDHDLRHYRQGDPVRSIHWKMSAKFNSLIIREPLVPPPHSRLLLITPWKKNKERDITLGRLRWISNYLLKWDLPYFVKFGDKGIIAEITKEEDLTIYLYEELCGATTARKPTIQDTGRFTWVFKVDAANVEEKL